MPSKILRCQLGKKLISDSEAGVGVVSKVGYARYVQISAITCSASRCEGSTIRKDFFGNRQLALQGDTQSMRLPIL